jgi:hypothetical protein
MKGTITIMRVRCKARVQLLSITDVKVTFITHLDEIDKGRAGTVCEFGHGGGAIPTFAGQRM